MGINPSFEFWIPKKEEEVYTFYQMLFGRSVCPKDCTGGEAGTF